jgi:hypothetical protein
MASSNEKRDIAFKHTLDVYHARSDRQWFEETYGARHVVAGSDVWADIVAYNDRVTALAMNVALLETDFVLTLDPFSNNQVWVAKLSPGSWPYSGPMTDYTALNLQRVKNWISPVVFGPSAALGFPYTLKQNDGSPIPDGNWEFLFSEGLLHLDDGFTHVEMGWTTPLKLTAYRYIGKFISGTSGVNVIPFAGVAEVDVTHSLGRYPIVQILKEETSGMFGFGGFGGGFGSSTVNVIMDEANYEVYHVDVNSFALVMDNYYNGQILYN